MQRITTLLASVAILTGCATANKQPIDSKALATLKNETVTYTVRKKPDFAAMTPGKAAFALIGAFAMISEGNKLVSDNNVPDPADAISVGLAQALEANQGARLAMPPVSVTADDADQLAGSAKGKARFVIDAKTINWSFVYFPTDWTHYRVIYSAKARLIDADRKVVVAEGFCSRVPKTNENAPTYDELLANDASVLKNELALAAQECVKTLKAEMLSVSL